MSGIYLAETPLVVGTDPNPAGTEVLRVGGNARVDGNLNVTGAGARLAQLASISPNGTRQISARANNAAGEIDATIVGGGAAQLTLNPSGGVTVVGGEFYFTPGGVQHQLVLGAADSGGAGYRLVRTLN